MVSGDPSFRHQIAQGVYVGGDPSFRDAQQRRAEASLRDELTAKIAGAQADIEAQLAELYRADTQHLHGDLIADGATKLLRLGALRDQLVGGAKDVTALRSDIAAAVADIHAYTADVRASAASTQGAAMRQVVSMAEYRRQTEDIDRRIAHSYVEENRHLAEARDVARRYGIDISGFEQERTALEEERDAARTKGDKLDERKADALIAQNTYNTMASETDSITDPKERAKHLAETQAQERIVEERRTALEEQIRLEAQRTAAERHLSPTETSAYVASSSQEQMAQFDARAAALKGSARQNAAPAEHGSARNDTPSSITKLAPETLARTQQAASSIRASYGTSAGSVDDFDLAKPKSAQIALAIGDDAHTKVEVPKTVAQPHAAPTTAVNH